jgi:hypothetical protein
MAVPTGRTLRRCYRLVVTSRAIFGTPFLQLDGDSLIGNTRVGRAHFRTGIVGTGQNTTSAFCVVGNTQPTRFSAQGFFPEESSGR